MAERPGAEPLRHHETNHENEGREGKTISAKRGRERVTARKSRRALVNESASVADIRREMKERRAVLMEEAGELMAGFFMVPTV